MAERAGTRSDEPQAARVAVVARRPLLRAGLSELLLRGGVEVALELDPGSPGDERPGASAGVPSLDEVDALVVELADLEGLAGDAPGWLATALAELLALLLVEAPGQPLPPALAAPLGADADGDTAPRGAAGSPPTPRPPSWRRPSRRSWRGSTWSTTRWHERRGRRGPRPPRPSAPTSPRASSRCWSWWRSACPTRRWRSASASASTR